MNSITVEKTKTHIDYKRVIGTFQGRLPGPTLVFIGGIHGNEQSGVYALQQVLQELEGKEDEFCGKFIALAGNLTALQKGVRYLDQDLNRLFTSKIISEIRNGKPPVSTEEKEQRALLSELDSIIKQEKGPVYFFDLHTTSSKTIPFITVNDSLLNRRYTKNYPLPIVLGIEEYLEGPLLNYINELGYVAFGFEGGQHEDPEAIENHRAFIYTSLLLTDALPKSYIQCENAIKKLKLSNTQNHIFYEIIYRYKIENDAAFSMKGNYQNFQKIAKAEAIAENDKQIINAKFSGQIFMPLYQGKGNDGFFIIQKIPKIFLVLSKWIRNVKLDQLVVLLPGVCWENRNKGHLKVNLKIARFFTKQFFHLMGYRSKVKDDKFLIAKNREHASKKELYTKASWYKK